MCLSGMKPSTHVPSLGTWGGSPGRKSGTVEAWDGMVDAWDGSRWSILGQMVDFRAGGSIFGVPSLLCRPPGGLGWWTAVAILGHVNCSLYL